MLRLFSSGVMFGLVMMDLMEARRSVCSISDMEVRRGGTEERWDGISMGPLSRLLLPREANEADSSLSFELLPLKLGGAGIPVSEDRTLEC